MQQQIYSKLSNLADKWIAEANVINSKFILSIQEVGRAKTLLDCAEALSDTITEINKS